MPDDQVTAGFVIGCLIGAVLGYIVRYLQDIKAKEDVIEDKVDRLLHPHEDEGGFMSHRIVANVMMVVVLVIVVYAAFMSQKASNDVEDKRIDDKIALCKSGEDSRRVQRGLVEAIYELATGSLERPKGSPPLTKAELQQYNAYIDRVNNFRTQMYAQIKPSEACAPFVEDDNVKPPTAPYPNISK